MTNTELISKIKAEIEGRINELNKDKYISADAQVCRTSELNYLLRFLSTLESEKPIDGLEEEIDKIWKTCEPIDEGMGVETANIHIEQFDYLARHFAQWGAEHLKK